MRNIPFYFTGYPLTLAVTHFFLLPYVIISFVLGTIIIGAEFQRYVEGKI